MWQKLKLIRQNHPDPIVRSYAKTLQEKLNTASRGQYIKEISQFINDFSNHI